MISTLTFRWRSLLSTNQRASSPNSSAWADWSVDSSVLFLEDWGERTPARTMGMIWWDDSERRSRALNRSPAGVASTIATSQTQSL